MSLPFKFAKTMNFNCLGRIGHVVNLTPIRTALAANVRVMSGRANCAKIDGPRCSKEELKKKGCDEDKDKDKKKEASPFKSMWENPECCMNPCPDAMPRFDELYYKASDKAKRKYMQTWIECPPIKIVPKKVCCFEPSTLPPLERRTKENCPKTACSPGDECKSQTGGKCRKILSPGCKQARDPPKCKTQRVPSPCKKVCTPYPSFSECTRDKPKPKHPVECGCLSIPSMCDIYAQLQGSSGNGNGGECARC